MRKILSLLPLVTAVAVMGCGQPVVESSVPATSEHHGGILVPLTDEQAYAELLNGDRVKKGKAVETTLVAYLLQRDLKTPLPGTPASVEIKIGTPKGDQVVALKAAPDPADPLGTSRFVSTPGPFELNQVGGVVTVQVDGKTLSGAFRGPR
jgi:hypothetical protein